MDKNTLLAVVLSVVIISIGFAVQSHFFPQEQVAQQDVAVPLPEEETNQAQAVQDIQPAQTSTDSEAMVTAAPMETAVQTKEYVMETNLYRATFTNKGGDLLSLKLKKHSDNGDLLEMIKRGETDLRAFSIKFGGPQANAVDSLFSVTRQDGNVIEFGANFLAPGTGIPFTLKKKYTFAPDEYMLSLEITIENSVNEYPGLNTDGFSYTLEMGPQIGPDYLKLDGRNEYRRYYTYNGEKRKDVKIPKSGFESITERMSWTAIVGKYFAVAAVTDSTPYTITFSDKPVDGLQDASSMYFSRPVIKSSKNSDIFKFYIGPKTAKELRKFDEPSTNSFNLSKTNLEDLIDQGRILGWLENILKLILELCYKLIPNYGVAIILLTLITKVILFPFTHKSYESTSKMQKLGPKIEELKAKYKDNPNKMNAAMAELYKKEGVNPLGGCLPILFQMPIFFALYGLLNKHFDLRGAMFIPGWIPDLSAPESIFHLPFTIPILGWEDIRLLPIIYVFTQMLYTKLMSTGNTAANSQMQMMTKFMPLMFFFILYNMPSGLILYWIVSNILTAGQQLYINRFMKKKEA